MVTDSESPYWLNANWDAPPHIHAGTTTRLGGNSAVPYDSLNLAMHVGDNPATVQSNRGYLLSQLDPRLEPTWLKQVHSDRIIHVDTAGDKIADGSYSDTAGQACVVLTADCVPVLMCNGTGTRVAAVHVGWRGFCEGIIANAAKLFEDAPETTLVWIGPHIMRDNYEVGSDVYQACLTRDPMFESAFTTTAPGKWHVSLETMIRQEFSRYTIKQIYSSGSCCYEQGDLFYSYRREGRTGRMASMIWMSA